ncbi:MAG: AMP-dependent synthetase/ligase [Pseudomonadota bacterium]|uniref:AMP-dependent synthetase/ligase n=1 Tax=Thermithiobacillus tepidarius TaxID=929 RepID=UPI00040A6FA7|nr:long-chain fatty acid--CoA ligase [Thermithiobacillus tepidarius]
MDVNLSTISSLAAGLFQRLERWPERTAALRPTAEGYAPIRGREMASEVRRWARGLLALGVRPGDRVAIMAGNSPEWAMLDFAVLSVGAVTVPIYPTYGLTETLFVLEDSGASLMLVDGRMQLEALRDTAPGCLPEGRLYVRDPADAQRAGLPSWEALKDLGERINPELVDARLAAVGREDLATLVYTSGTSGWPKGVMLSHGNILANIEGFLRVVPLLPSDRVLSFLPLSHVFERGTGHFGAYLAGLEVAYAERPDTIIRDLTRARPTILISVPRLFQVLYARLLRDVAGKKGPLGFVLRRGLGLDIGGLVTGQGKGASRWLALHLLRLALHRRLGGRLRFFVSGGAPLPVEIGRFFLELGLPIVEGYGMTEASPVISANPPGKVRPGTVGPVLPNLELRFGEDGEILVRGPSVMRGYWKNEPATREALAGGWLHTGDVGRLDEAGYLVITDRKKELIVNSGGENVAPQKIEMRLATHPLINQAVVFGDRRPYLVALIHPNSERLQETLKPNPSAEEVQSAVRQAVQWALKDLPAYEQVRKFLLLDKPLTQEGGELTPTLKVKRRVLWERFGAAIDALYDGKEA